MPTGYAEGDARVGRPALVPLAEVITEAKAGFACGEEDPAGVLQIRMNNLTRGGTLNLTRKRRVPAGHGSLNSCTLEPGDVLFNATNSPDLVGKTTLFPGLDAVTVFSNHVLRLRANPDRLVPGYLAHWLQFQFEAGVFRSMCKQWVNQATVGREPLLGLRIPLAPVPEQRRAVGLLDAVNDLRVKRRASIAILDELAESVFVDMFGDRHEIYSRWPTEPLGHLLDFLTSGSRGWSAHYTDVPGSLFLRIQNVLKNELVLRDVAYVNAPGSAAARRTRVEPGDVLLSITADLGRTAVVPDGIGDAFISQHLSILRSSTLDPHFLSAYLSSPPGQARILGRNRQGVKAGLNFDDVRSLVIPRPPRELQVEFSRRLASTRALRHGQRAHLSELDALFDSVRHRAFSGTLCPATAA